MTEIYIKNIDNSNVKEIKIYSLEKDNVLPSLPQFTGLDNFNTAIGVKLLAAGGAAISCVGATNLLFWKEGVLLNGITEVIVSWTIAGVETTSKYVGNLPLNNISLEGILIDQLNLNIPGFKFGADGFLKLEILNNETSGHNPDLENVRISISCSDAIVTIPDETDVLSPAVWLSEDNLEMTMCLVQQGPV